MTSDSSVRQKSPTMKIFDSSKKEMMSVSAVETDGDILVIKGKIFGTMPMTAKLSPEEARNGLRLLSPKLVWFLLTFLFRSSSGRQGKA